MTRQQQLARLSHRLGHTFDDPTLLEMALTHRSLGSVNNERLEFLGDSILNFTIAEYLYQAFPSSPEGELSRLRALLVRGETLADIARQMDLGDYLNLGEGELKSGGHRRASILADALEALIGAIYLSSGTDSAKRCILAWYGDRLDAITLTHSDKDPKTELQEWLQGRKMPLPQYQVVAVHGEPHNQSFSIACHVPQMFSEPTLAQGSSRKAAEKEAASLMLAKLEQHHGK